MKTVEVEICALKNNEAYTLGRGRTYGAAIADVRKRAAFPHSVTAIVLSWDAPLIRAYTRPQHQFGYIVPVDACRPAAPHIEDRTTHDPGTRAKFCLYKTARLVAADEFVGLRFVPESAAYRHGAFFQVTPRRGPAFSVWPDELADFCL